MECLVNIGFFQMMTEEEYNERERMVEKVKSFFFFDRKWGGIISCLFHKPRWQEKNVLNQ